MAANVAAAAPPQRIKTTGRLPLPLARAIQLPIYPLGLIAALVVADFVAWWIPVTGMIRPLVVIGGLTLLIQLGASAVLGRDRGAYIAATVATAATDVRLLAFLLVAFALPVGFMSAQARRLVGLDWPKFTRFVNVISIAALLASVVAIVVVVVSLPKGLRHDPAPVAASGAEAPDIYLVLLDGYPRADTLQSTLGLDIGPFLDDMGGLGFDLAEHAHSNYNRTALSLATMLNAAHIDDLMPAPPGGFASQNRQLITFINEGAAIRDARALGYEIVDIPTDFSYLAPVTADQVLDSGQITQFEFTLAHQGLLPFVFVEEAVDWLRMQHRERILASFDRLEQLPTEGGSKPRLILAHLMLPHHPIVFRRDGSLANVPECFWADCHIADPMTEVARSGIAEQVEYTNERVEHLARKIIETSTRPAVVVFFSDHGFRHWVSAKAETFRSLLLSYTPDHPNVFPDTASPINLIPRILNAYLGTTLPLAEEDVWYGVGVENGYYPLNRMTAEPP